MRCVKDPRVAGDYDVIVTFADHNAVPFFCRQVRHLSRGPTARGRSEGVPHTPTSAGRASTTTRS